MVLRNLNHLIKFIAINGFSSVTKKSPRPFLNSNRGIVIINKWSQNFIFKNRTVKNRLIFLVKISARRKNQRVCAEYAQGVEFSGFISDEKEQKSKYLQNLYNLGLKSLCYTSWCSLGQIHEIFIKKSGKGLERFMKESEISREKYGISQERVR